MIGRKFTARPKFSGAIWLWTLVGLGLLAGDLLVDAVLWPAALLPLVWAITLWLTRPRAVDVEITERGLIVGDAREEILYCNLQSLALNRAMYDPEQSRALPKGPVKIVHTQGAIELPPGGDYDPAEFYRFLWSHLVVNEPQKVHGNLLGYQQQQAQLYGPDMVHCYVARDPHCTRRSWRPTLICLSTFLTGVVLIVLAGVLAQGNDKRFTAHLSWAVTVTFVGLFATLIAVLLKRERAYHGVKNWRDAGMVISPEGIALSQGLLMGTMKWNELQRVDYVPAGGLRLGLNVDQLKLVVPGVAIRVVDIYNRPLRTIYTRICDYWRPPAMSGQVAALNAGHSLR